MHGEAVSQSASSLIDIQQATPGATGTISDRNRLTGEVSAHMEGLFRITMLPLFLLVVSLVSVEGLSEGHCLGYDVLCTTADYELRRYNESVFVGIHAREFPVAVADVVPLHHYFSLENSEGMEIQLTGQVLVSLSGFRVLAIHLMLPEELWDNPPTPTNPRLFITRFPMMDVFARFIRGFLFTDASDFNRTLTEQNAHVNNSNFFLYFCLGKSVAFRHLPHGQEIWFVSTGGFDCPAP
ncbi:uncharacterized protein [Hemitrygon akajei]|uniref:uncharacterized protein n=1 Tax=Hemitrygon akajei TaxID=2704970 RepID=UPI003BF999E5